MKSIYDCYELNTLRWLRDGWLSSQPDGPELIQQYYEIAPDIVHALEQSSQKDAIYVEIWTKYIQPCVELIELHAYSACKELYQMMVYDLKNKLLKEC